jgi:NTE family protein
MLRKYLHDWRLEQLAVPRLSVTVDLVSGNSVVRERGDAVYAILEFPADFESGTVPASQ